MDEHPQQFLRDRLVSFQRDIARLKQQDREREELFQDRERAFLLELFAILDGFDNLERNIRDKEDTLDKTGRRLVKNVQAIKRKMLRLLRTRHIEPMEINDNKAQIEQCKVVGVQSDPTRENREIISVEKKGYIDTEQNTVVRKAEVVTVNND